MTDDERFEAIKLYYADNEYIPHRDEGFVLSYAERHRARADRLAGAMREVQEILIPLYSRDDRESPRRVLDAIMRADGTLRAALAAPAGGEGPDRG
jgi:hypothetical protein